MSALKPGMKVVVKNSGFAVLLYPFAEPAAKWAVLLKPNKNEPHRIVSIPSGEIETYVNHCWNKECANHKNWGSINSEKHDTCYRCHWVICPVCSACHQDGCRDDMIRIESVPEPDELPF